MKQPWIALAGLLALGLAGGSLAGNNPGMNNGTMESRKAATMMTEKAIFAGGCFWCMEHPFEKLDGVISVTSGYTGGQQENPTYSEVSAGRTGHTEAVEIIYEPGKIGYEHLLETFRMNIDPTDAGGQFVDRGSQ